MKPRIALLGAGVMGEAIAGYAIESGFIDRSDIVIVERLTERRAEITKRLGVIAEDAARALPGADAIVLAVKPQDFAELAAEAAPHVPENCIAISIMAGVPLARIREALAHDRVVRAMPNTPAQIGAGVTVWLAADEVDDDAKARIVRPLLASLGAQYEVDHERYLDMATAVNGSGPGYVFFVIEAMIDAAVQIGFARQLASDLVIGTVLGSAEYARASGRHPAELRNLVTSPGGTTAAGLFELESAGVRAAFARAIQAAYDRSKALGG